jgi:integrase
MASIARNKKTGACRLLIREGDGKRRCVRLGRMPAKLLRGFKSRIDVIIAANKLRQPLDEETATWLGELDSTLYNKLAAAGLVTARETVGVSTLDAFLSDYIELRKSKIKPRTYELLQGTRKFLVDYFGATRPLWSISKGEALEFRCHLDKTLADNTVRRICGRARQFFSHAFDKRLIRTNPFHKMADIHITANKKREFDVTPAIAQKVLSTCPNLRCQLIFALARWGGLRCPSEVVLLRWGDIDWEKNCFTVHSPKTEKHPNGDSRVVPLFPELRPYLEEAFNKYESEHGKPPSQSEYVIHVRNREGTNNFGPQMDRIIAKAGFTPWEKTFQNCRATRATELVKEHGVFLACKWLGHTALVARKHYWQKPTQADINAAAGVTSGEETGAAGGRAQKCTRQPAATDAQRDATKEQPLEIAENCEGLQSNTEWEAPRVGLEPTTQRLTAACSTS